MASSNDEAAIDQTRLRIVIADDHALVRGGLALLIEMASPGAEVLQANNHTQVMAFLEENESVDLLLLDLMMPGMQGEIDIKAISQARPEIPIIIVSVKEDMDSIRSSLAAGAMGYIPKTSSPDVTVSAIQLVLAGGVYVPPHVLSLDKSDSNGASEDKNKTDNNFGLTHRQIEVLNFIAAGKSNQAIAGELGLTTGTIKMHVSAIFKRLNVSSRTEAAMKYSELKKHH
jgi:DNA-binding NarL/FixJ family response regulator